MSSLFLGGGRSILLSYRDFLVPVKYTISIRKLQDNFSRKIYLPLQPDIALETAADLRLTEKVAFVDADVKVHIIALQMQHIDLLVGGGIGHLFILHDIAYDLILVTLGAAWHETGIDDGIEIFRIHSPGNHGVEIHVLDGQTFDSILIAIFRRGKKLAALSRTLLLLVNLFAVFQNRK